MYLKEKWYKSGGGPRIKASFFTHLKPVGNNASNLPIDTAPVVT